eukprot:CAMPEP_0114483606 /NCGR_PEP_ID=MMETSP0104-20121206/18965_1 /TAXON_ID=37642 ORGANISM="Paraphysomonas imperforata, Strain PA2" /NCGR_SAMPLE_ID=MMETSP0104 /ASSEMBLY_ACC=CAM_ASM_000202 /LENGTH=72 /DNA_ID=CAMNT_0001659589 /DNA_START=36 /DNA_END=254 /DNA_ORIENTATION=+
MPAYTTAKFLGSNLSPTQEKGVENMPLAPQAAEDLQGIKYPPVIGVYLAYPNEAFRVRQFDDIKICCDGYIV